MAREIYFEIRPYGQYIRVHAIDAQTGLETFTTGPKSMGLESLKNSARRKLDYLLRKQAKAMQEKKKTWFA